MVKTSRIQRANHGIHLRLQDVYVGNGSISLSFCPALEHGSGPSLTKLEARTYERGRTLPAALAVASHTTGYKHLDFCQISRQSGQAVACGQAHLHLRIDHWTPCVIHGPKPLRSIWETACSSEATADRLEMRCNREKKNKPS